MTEEQRTIASVSQLFSTAWFWLVPLLGGIGDYVVQMQRGIKPRAPFHVVLLSVSLHSVVAVVAGCLLAMVCGALGYRDELAFGAAGGIGGFLGVRLFDIGILFIRLKSGIDPNK